MFSSLLTNTMSRLSVKNDLLRLIVTPRAV